LNLIKKFFGIYIALYLKIIENRYFGKNDTNV